MKLYSHKSIPDAKFESGSSSSFGDLTPQIFPGMKERVIKFGYLSPENEFSVKNRTFSGTFYVFPTQNCPPPPPSQVQQVSSRGNFLHFQNFGDVSMRKEQQQSPGFINPANIWSEHELRIKTKIHKIWAS